MSARQRYDEMIRDVIGPQLKRDGFKRVRNRFARWRGTGWQIIDFQASQWGSRDHVSFTINLGSALEALPKRSNWDARKPPSETAAHLRERMGPLLEGGCDRWWDLDAETDTQSLARELLLLLERVAMPWLEARSSLERVLGLISNSPEDLSWHDLLVLPALLTDAGHSDACEAVLAEADRRGMSFRR